MNRNGLRFFSIAFLTACCCVPVTFARADDGGLYVNSNHQVDAYDANGSLNEKYLVNHPDVVQEYLDEHDFRASGELQTNDIISATGSREFLKGGVGNFLSRQGPGLSTEGPRLLLDARIAKGIRAAVSFDLKSILGLSNGELVATSNWSAFIETAMFEIDWDQVAGVPIVTVIGKQEIPTGFFDNAIPEIKQSPIYELSRREQVFGFQLKIDKRLAKFFDSVILSVASSQSGQLHIGGGPMGSVVVSKNLLKNLAATGGFAYISNRIGNEKRASLGLVYKHEGHWRVFAGETFSVHNELYPNSRSAVVVGVAANVGPGEIGFELNHNSARNQPGVGYTWLVSERMRLETSARWDFCHTNINCKSGPEISVGATYAFAYRRPIDHNSPTGSHPTLGEPGFQMPEDQWQILKVSKNRTN